MSGHWIYGCSKCTGSGLSDCMECAPHLSLLVANPAPAGSGGGLYTGFCHGDCPFLSALRLCRLQRMITIKHGPQTRGTGSSALVRRGAGTPAAPSSRGGIGQEQPQPPRTQCVPGSYLQLIAPLHTYTCCLIYCGNRVCQFTTSTMSNLREFKNCLPNKHYNATDAPEGYQGNGSCTFDQSAYASRYTNSSAGDTTAHKYSGKEGAYSVAQVSPCTYPARHIHS